MGHPAADVCRPVLSYPGARCGHLGLGDVRRVIGVGAGRLCREEAGEDQRRRDYCEFPKHRAFLLLSSSARLNPALREQLNHTGEAAMNRVAVWIGLLGSL